MDNEMKDSSARVQVHEDGIPLTENARKVLERRYLRKGIDGRPIETIEEMFRRVARAIAAVDAAYGRDALETEQVFYDLLTKLRFMPNSPTFTGAGTPLGQLAACFVLPIADDMGKRPDGIFSTLRAAALIQQTGGGNGFSFSRLRPRGEHVVTSAGQATGPVGFLRVYDKAFGEIAQGGSRRGANMGVLRVDHPDIREFIRCKAREGEITNFNISVAIIDDFMRAVENDELWELRFPDVEDPRYRDFHGTINQAEKVGIPIKVYDRVPAKELFDAIVKHAYRNGEPGVLFIDAANRDNPVPHLYELEATNPCVTGDTLVATPHGWRRADSIRVGDEILTVSGVGRVAEIEVNPNMPVYLVEFSDGGSIRATASHQFYVRDPRTGAFHPRRLDALCIGDEVRVLRPLPMRVTEVALAMHGPAVGAPLAELDAAEGTARVLSITPAGIETVYDLYEPETDTWITAGYVSRGCGEQWLGPYENCCLGSINLARHVTEDGRIDWEKLRETIEIATHFLDNVVSANKYVPAVPQLKEAAEKCRRIGLGIMGLGDVMYHLGVRYGSPEGEELAAQIMEFVRFHAMKTSIELARQRGPFPAINGSIYDPKNLKWKPPTPLRPYERDFGRPPLDWNEIVEGIKQYGIRNAAQTTIAPTGTIATVAGCEGYGCEPVFALAYIRHVQDGDQVLDLQYTSPLFEKALIKAGIDEDTRQAIYEEVMRTGTCQHIEAVPEHIRHTFVVASDITPEEHVRMQAALQRFVDSSISKTINFPATATEDDVARAYFQAWKLGCKGLTVYVTGTREKVVLETRETLEAKRRAEAAGPSGEDRGRQRIKKPRPRKLHGFTYKQATPLGTAYVTVTEDEEGRPFEVFLNVGKGGSDTAAAAEAIGRLISLVLRLPSTVPPEERLSEVIDELSGIGGGRTLGFGPDRVASLPDGVAQALAEHLGRSPIPAPPLAHDPGGNGAPEEFEDNYCPECGNATLVREEGCRKCYFCGFSEC